MCFANQNQNDRHIRVMTLNGEEFLYKLASFQIVHQIVDDDDVTLVRFGRFWNFRQRSKFFLLSVMAGQFIIGRRQRLGRLDHAVDWQNVDHLLVGRLPLTEQQRQLGHIFARQVLVLFQKFCAQSRFSARYQKKRILNKINNIINNFF